MHKSPLNNIKKNIVISIIIILKISQLIFLQLFPTEMISLKESKDIIKKISGLLQRMKKDI